MKLLALLLLLGVVYPSLNEVVKSFKAKCPEFFVKNQHSHEVDPPTLLKGNQFKCICQRWKGKYRYATLYDIKRRIPIYSAYKFEGKKDIPRNGNWKTEPQLDEGLKPENREMREMRPAQEEKLPFKNQARNNDYPRAGAYTRGHLFPNSYAADADQAESTFTLTNAAPQMQDSNEEWAKKVEELMWEEIKHNCMVNKTFPAYIVTGVVPGNVWVAIERERRTITQGVNIPTHYWSAYLCINSASSRLSRAFLAQQIYEIKPNRKTQFKKSNMTVADLESKLTGLFKQPFRVF
ncbi:endonuclease domain-containing 1 protein-like [Astyanax mexicanus]|uniref:Endonuclease domain-containing 1 protein-like n=1 Tax=Astyanax mexicanus TaxID=7994 RepID=A0A8T2KR91_ASTMX|nr:endonuclease domain-containing 1 protein-like [Astyanax mexicanus]KAG9262141.1 endonuclease domain-containing 1 protein-like [Astyanax mexicanus]